MTYDEDGEPVYPEALNIPQPSEDEVFVVGIRVERASNHSVTTWGVFVPAISAVFNTTQGPIRTYWTRAEASALAEGLRSVLCDG